MIDKTTITQDDFFAQWKAVEERYLKELNWIKEVKRHCTPEVLSIRKKALTEGDSKVEHYTKIITEAWQRAQEINSTYLICASDIYVVLCLTNDFIRTNDIGAIQGSYSAGTYRELPVIVSPALDKGEMLCGADTPTPEYNINSIDASKFIMLKLED